jgi:hypothetical protein
MTKTEFSFKPLPDAYVTHLRVEMLTLSERLTLVAHTSLIQDTPRARPGGG